VWVCQIVPSVRTAPLETNRRRSVVLLFNNRLVFFCIPLRYTSQRVERCADDIEMHVFGEDIKVKLCADRFTTDYLLSVSFKDAVNSY